MNPEFQTLVENDSSLTVLRDEPLSRWTSFGIGGPATYFVKVTSPSQLASVLSATKRCALEPLLLGAGTNLLVSDLGFEGVAVKMEIDHISFEDGRVTAGAGATVAALVESCIERGMGDLQFAAGLPGTVGGGVAGNAGCFGSDFSSHLLAARVVTRDGEILEIEDPADFQFDYRTCAAAKRGWVIAEASFRTAPRPVETLRDEARAHLDLRKEKHPKKGIKTAGSYFKNLPPAEPGGRRRAAGALLDKVGAKGMSVGDAAVFERHANIVVNRGNATAADVLELTELMAKRVKEELGVQLEPEVRFVGRR